MGAPLVSIIIPTRNRQFYANKTIRQIVSLNEDIQIVVQDNSDDDTLGDTLADLIRSNLIEYYHESQPLSFSENYNLAAGHAAGTFLCAVGDDDGVLPFIMNCARWMEAENIDAVTPAKDVTYYYPNAGKRQGGYLGIGQYTGVFEMHNPEAGVVNLLDDGGQNYLSKKLAGSYHGLVRMKALKEVKRQTGFYYDGLSPDMYSVACLSLLDNLSLAVIDYPITIPGICPMSGSAASDAGKHAGQLEASPHLKALPHYVWSTDVPRFYSVETIWAETLLYAIRAMKRESLIERYFNSKMLAKHLYINNPKYQKEILATLSPRLQALVKTQEKPLNRKMGHYDLFNKAAVKLSRKRVVIRGVMDIDEAIKVATERLLKMGTPEAW